MGLADYVAPTKSLVLDGGLTLSIRGLGADDIVNLMMAQSEQVKTVFAKAINGGVQTSDMEGFIVGLLADAPALVAVVIATGCGEPDAWENAASIPFGDQIVILDTIFEMTLSRSGGGKKLMEIIGRAAQAAARFQ